MSTTTGSNVNMSQAPTCSSSPAPSYMEKNPTRTTAPLNLKPNASLWQRYLRPRWLLGPHPSETASFMPTRAAPLNILPPRENIIMKTTNVRLCCCRRRENVKHYNNAGASDEYNKQVSVQASVKVTVKACCCGPDGREIRGKSTHQGPIYTASVKCSVERQTSIAHATAQATETAAKKSHDEAVAQATAAAVMELERKFAKRAAKALYK